MDGITRPTRFCIGLEIDFEVKEMGMWGFELYQNDTALDVKDEFYELFNAGKTAQEITDKLTEDYKSIMGDTDEEPIFWLALADTQWDLGVLLPVVKEKALYWIDNDCGIFKYQTIDISAKVQRVYKCQWKLGDVFAYKLESELAKERGLYGRYFLIQKVDEGIWYPGHIVPIVYVKITNNTNLPSNVEEYDQLEYVQTWFTKYEERFLPIDMRHPEEDIAEKSKINYQVS